MRDELLAGEIFNTMFEARIMIEKWCQEYNTVRPHSARGLHTQDDFSLATDDYIGRLAPTCLIQLSLIRYTRVVSFVFDEFR